MDDHPPTNMTIEELEEEIRRIEAALVENNAEAEQRRARCDLLHQQVQQLMETHRALREFGYRLNRIAENRTGNVHPRSIRRQQEYTRRQVIAMSEVSIERLNTLQQANQDLHDQLVLGLEMKIRLSQVKFALHDRRDQRHRRVRRAKARRARVVQLTKAFKRRRQSRLRLRCHRR